MSAFFSALPVLTDRALTVQILIPGSALREGVATDSSGEPILCTPSPFLLLRLAKLGLSKHGRPDLISLPGHSTSLSTTNGAKSTFWGWATQLPCPLVLLLLPVPHTDCRNSAPGPSGLHMFGHKRWTLGEALDFPCLEVPQSRGVDTRSKVKKQC